MQFRKQSPIKDASLTDEREQQLELIAHGHGWLDSENLGTVFFYGSDYKEAMTAYQSAKFKTPFEEVAFIAGLEKEYDVKIESVRA